MEALAAKVLVMIGLLGMNMHQTATCYWMGVKQCHLYFTDRSITIAVSSSGLGGDAAANIVIEGMDMSPNQNGV